MVAGVTCDAEAVAPFGARQRGVRRGSMLRAVVPVGNGAPASWPSWETWQQQGTVWASLPDHFEPCGGMFRISTYAHAVIRELEPTGPLPLEAIINPRAALPPNNAHASGGPPLHLAVTVFASSERTYFCDIGSTVNLYGEGVAIAWVAPAGSFDLGGQPWTTPASAMVVEVAAQAEVTRIESSNDASCGWRFTQTYVVPANTDAAWQVPLGARSFVAQRDSAGAFATGFLQQAIGSQISGGPSLVLAASRFENGQTLLEQLAPNVSHLQPPTVAELQVWSVVWFIVP